MSVIVRDNYWRRDCKCKRRIDRRRHVSNIADLSYDAI